MEGKRSKKRLSECLEKVYRFQILLPDGRVTDIKLRDPGDEIRVSEFVQLIRRKLERSLESERQRKIMWSDSMHLEDMQLNKYKKVMSFDRFHPNKCHILQLLDGFGKPASTFQNMWDLTPQTDLLAELPAEYTFETALADLIDNALQAVWANDASKRKLISVMVSENRISIFDTGPGMDDSEDNSIVKWGRMGSSNHRSSRKLAIGGNPPYLMPFFGMFGYGGPMASMHLGRCAVVSSKTATAKKVYTLHLEREGLLKKTTSGWKTDGGLRDPSDEEIERSPHGSFTLVEIHEPRFKVPEAFKLQCMLKDIYFPYVQCDEAAMARTTMPTEFLVNATNLAEIDCGEMAVTNLHSCNGPEFILQLSFSLHGNDTSKCRGSLSQKANARLRCIYIPIVEGKENINRILEKLESEGCGINEDFENFARTSIRRLGRLLPDARWLRLPFMEPKLRKGDKAQLLRRCCARVKCFIETDAAFCPTPSKTNLAHQDAFTIALRNFGNKPPEKVPDVTVDIFKDGRPLSILHLEKEYQDWVFQMHDNYDEELDCGDDEPVLVISPPNKRRLGITSDVVRVHQVVKRKGYSWKSGQKVKFLKGSVSGAKNNLYMTLEYILLEGFQGDAGGEARLICRPIDCPKEKGCLLSCKNDHATLDIGEALSYPISTIDCEKCIAIDDSEWLLQVEKKQQRSPSHIELLGSKLGSQLGIHEELPVRSSVSAGFPPPSEIVAVIRPVSFSSSFFNDSVVQKRIVKFDAEMSMRVTYMSGDNSEKDKFILSECVKASARNGFQGLYIFSLGSKYPMLFHSAGTYTFCFAVVCIESKTERLEVKVRVEPNFKRGTWRVCDDKGNLPYKGPIVFRVGEHFPCIRVACADDYLNRIPFDGSPQIQAEVSLGDEKITVTKRSKLSSDRLSIEIWNILLETGKLDMIGPGYNGLLEISSQSGKYLADVSCQVFPGSLKTVKYHHSPALEKCLQPNYVIQELNLEMFDVYGNHIQGGVEVNLKLEGLCCQDYFNSVHKVNDQGYVNLCGLVKVTAFYGANAALSVYLGDQMISKKTFSIDKRELRPASMIPRHCYTGSKIENIVFEIVDPSGNVDENISGQHHTLSIAFGQSTINRALQYTFYDGKCAVPVLSVPEVEGEFEFVAYHTHHAELRTSFLVCTTPAPKLEPIEEVPFFDPIQSEICHNVDPSPFDTPLYTPTQTSALVVAIIDDAKRLDEEMSQVAEQIKSSEMNIQMLSKKKSLLTQDIQRMQAALDPQALDHIACLMNPKQMMKSLEQGGSAAAVIYHLSKAVLVGEPREHFMEDVVGIVALLGTVADGRLSRMVAKYLGEDFMLAIVCKSSYGARLLEIYKENGEVDVTRGLCKEAAGLGMDLPKQFNVICLEDIRPYLGDVKGPDTQRLLDLPEPRLPSGQAPPGFLGYAVNMITLDVCHFHLRTKAGFGLRETLFYCLLGEMQVYERRIDMQKAKACLRSGAISLDGGIMRENGVICLGKWEPEVRFPVRATGGSSNFSEHTIDILKEKNNELAELTAKISKEVEALSKLQRKFAKKCDRLRQFLDSKKHLRGYLEYNP